MEGQQHEAQSPFWSTVSKLAVAVPIAGILGAAVSAIALGGADYGRMINALDTEKARANNLEKSNDEYRKNNQNWIEAYSKLKSELADADVKVKNMQNDQCESIRNDISNLQYKIESTYGYTDSDQKRTDLQIMMQQHQQSLQACFASRR